MSSVIDEHDGEESRNEFKSHYNIVTVSRHAADTRNKVYVSPFTPDYQALDIDRNHPLFITTK